MSGVHGAFAAGFLGHVLAGFFVCEDVWISAAEIHGLFRDEWEGFGVGMGMRA